MKTKAPKLPKPRPAELLALLLCRENLEGGDPVMTLVTGETMRRLELRGLVATCYYDDDPNDPDCREWGNVRRRRVFERAHIPTRLGLAVLDAATYGPRP